MIDMVDIAIDVTQDDIDNGNRNDKWSCPIANAWNRKFPASEVSVGTESIAFIDCDGFSARVQMPYKAKRFIEKFDNLVTVEPFSFTVTVPRCMTDVGGES